MKKFTLLLFSLFAVSFVSEAQLKLKKKAEKKANQVIDDFLFGKKKKNNQESSNSNSNTNTSNSVSNSTESNDSYTPEEVNFESLNLGEAIHFNTLINMLPERTQGFSRSGKPNGARYNTQGMSYSTGSKEYLNGDREMTITLNDYLGAEYFATAQTAQQFEYESTDGFSKSVELNEMNGWMTYDNSSQQGTIMLFRSERFFATITTEKTSESELKAIANDLNLSRLK
ncbi:MAG: hypothetical protein AB8B73_02660 [Ekhidna sp.]